jgi:pyruvate kinase
VREAEKTPKERPLLRNMDLSSVTSAQMGAASLIAEKVKAKWIVSVTLGGNSCLKMTRFRSLTPVLGLTNSLSVVRRMALYWGITPMLAEVSDEDISFLSLESLDLLKSKLSLSVGDKIVITHGDGRYFQHGYSNSVRVEVIKDAKKKHSQDFQKADFSKGSIHLDNYLCASCQICLTTCPHNIYEVNASNNQTMINVQNAQKCTLDFECVEKCPTGAIEIIPKQGLDDL